METADLVVVSMGMPGSKSMRQTVPLSGRRQTAPAKRRGLCGFTKLGTGPAGIPNKADQSAD